MRKVCLSSSAIMIALALGCSRGSAPTSPSRPPPAASGLVITAVPSAAAFGASKVDFARCLQGAADAACQSGGRITLNAVGGAAVTTPGAPRNLVTSSSGSSVTLTWSAPASADAAEYIVEAGSASGQANLANFATGNTATSFSAGGIGNGTYYVRIRAQNAAGTSAASNESALVVGSTACTSAPNAPGGLAVTASGSTVSLTWNAPAAGCAPTSYVLQAGSSPGLSNLANSNVGNTTSYVATGVGSGTYYVRVRAANAFGQSGGSNEFTLVVGSAPTPPSAPTVFALNPHEPQVVDFGNRGGCSSSNSSRDFTVTTATPTQGWNVTWTGFAPPTVSIQLNRRSGIGPGGFNVLLGFNPQTPSPGGNCGAGVSYNLGGTIYLNADDHFGFDYIHMVYRMFLVF